MSVQKAIEVIWAEAAVADNPIAYLEEKAAKEYFSKLNAHARKRFSPEHTIWQNKEAVSYELDDCVITTISGTIIAITEHPLLR